MIRNMVRPVNLMSMTKVPHFFGRKMCSLVRGKAVWNSIMVGEALCEYVDGSFSRSITGREGKSTSKKSIYTVRTKCSLLMVEVVQCNQCVTSFRLISPGNGAMWRAQGQCLLLAYWTFRGGYRQTILGEWQSMLLTLPATQPLCPWPHWAGTGVAEERGLLKSFFLRSLCG